jgi:Uncharacterized conserved protein
MLSVDLIYLGGEKELYFKEAAAEYKKRLGAFCTFSEKSIKDEKLPNSPSETEIKTALEKESVKILDNIPEKSFRIALCIEGKQLSSEELADLFNSLPGKGFSRCAFLIGSSDGLSEHLKSTCHYKLSMSKMTFPHRLARVMLLEQIYRAFSILQGGKYHK